MSSYDSGTGQGYGPGSAGARPDGPPPAGATPTDGPESAAGPFSAGVLQDELVETRRQRDDFLEQLRRSQAEFANYQKRSKAQADADRQYAVSGLALDLLGVLDNFDRAIAVGHAAGVSSGGLLEGVEMVRKQLLSTLAKHEIVPIEAQGQPFDPNLHEALTREASADLPENTVVRELSRGYRHRDRILRPSKVAVSTRPAS